MTPSNLASHQAPNYVQRSLISQKHFKTIRYGSGLVPVIFSIYLSSVLYTIGKRCKSGEVAMNKKAGSKIACLVMCTHVSGCRSFFFRQTDDTCMGCTVAYTSTSGLPSLAGTSYHIKSGNVYKTVKLCKTDHPQDQVKNSVF